MKRRRKLNEDEYFWIIMAWGYGDDWYAESQKRDARREELHPGRTRYREKLVREGLLKIGETPPDLKDWQ